ncbi:MAG: hypothetical protein MI724_12495 [Spirochaetales bacterium]|nr:hypothetical protein [Spirochaetales bacterium]
MSRVMHLLALLFAMWRIALGPVVPLASQDAADGAASVRRDASDPPPRLAPSVPFESRELALLVVERGGSGAGERPLEVVRYGLGGSLRRPVALDLPVEGRSIVLEAWDWLRLTDRALALIDPADYDQWLHLEPGTQGLVLSEGRFELFRGAVHWLGENEDVIRSEVTSGDLIVTGRGRAWIRRRGTDVELTVERGRFEIERGDTLIAVASAGQERIVAVDDAFAVAERGGAGLFTERRDRLVRELDAALLALLADGTLDGNTLVRLWEAVLRFGPVFAAAEAMRAPWVTGPEVARSDIGEALRLLGAYDFRPPPAAGM